MLDELRTAPKVVGAKQVKRALRDKNVRWVFLAKDADPRVTDPIKEMCVQKAVQTATVPHMKDLGEACGINVGTAVVALF